MNRRTANVLLWAAVVVLFLDLVALSTAAVLVDDTLSQADTLWALAGIVFLVLACVGVALAIVNEK